jgi:hypothetical protein
MVLGTYSYTTNIYLQILWCYAPIPIRQIFIYKYYDAPHLLALLSNVDKFLCAIQPITKRQSLSTAYYYGCRDA